MYALPPSWDFRHRDGGDRPDGQSGLGWHLVSRNESPGTSQFSVAHRPDPSHISGNSLADVAGVVLGLPAESGRP
jgi:hypothetical protein